MSVSRAANHLGAHLGNEGLRLDDVQGSGSKIVTQRITRGSFKLLLLKPLRRPIKRNAWGQ